MKCLSVLLLIITMGMCGCAAYDNEAMAGAAVDMPDEKPMAPVLTGPSPTPSPNPQQLPVH